MSSDEDEEPNLGIMVPIPGGRGRLLRHQRPDEMIHLPGSNLPVLRDTDNARIKQSTFEVVINSNVKPSTLRRNLGRDPQGAVNSIGNSLRLSSNWLFRRSYRDNPAFYNIFKHVSRRGVPDGLPLVPADIQRVRWTPGETQIGERRKGGRIHIQGTLEVWHYTALQVDAKRCQKYFNYMITTLRNQNVQPSPGESKKWTNRNVRGVYVSARFHQGAEGLFLYNNRARITSLQKSRMSEREAFETGC